MKEIKQKKLLIILIILSIITIKLISKYSINNNYIKKYNNKVYEPSIAKKLLFINIQERYIAHYNYGTSLYQTEDYKKAKEEFTKALKTVPKKRVCYVRSNLALTEIKLLPEQGEPDVLIKQIEDIQKVLLENNCATENHNGIDQKSQEIYDYLEQIKQQMQGQGGDGEDGDGNGNQSDPDDGEEIDNEDDKIDQIKNKNRDANRGRNPANEHDYNDNNYNQAVW